MIEIIGLVITVIAVAGVVLNNKRRIECFYLWLFTNAVSGGIHLYVGVYSLALRDLIFFALAFHGILCWRRIKG
jgi:nicotinamide riboside transporter PnuC